MKQTTQLYQSPLYQQVEREWRETLIRGQLPSVSKVRRALTFEKYSAEHLMSHKRDHDVLHYDDIIDDTPPSTITCL